MIRNLAPAGAGAQAARPPPSSQEPCEAAPHRAASGAPLLSVDGFEGPLDGLLEMARAQKIDLTKLSIAELIDSFGRALQRALKARTATAPLGQFGDWLVMAATLAWLRSRLLLPATAAAHDAHDAAEALRGQLLDRAQMQVAADGLDRRPQLGRDVFARGTASSATPARRSADLTDLLRACLVALRLPDEPLVALRARPKFWTVADARTRLQERLAQQPGGARLESFLPPIAANTPARDRHCRAAVASTLLASLELARTGHLRLEQQQAWEEIQVSKAT